MRDLYALMNLKSPHLVQILDVGIQNRMVYYSMEYASGSTLAETLDRGELEIPLATRYLLHLCRAVLAAHQCQVVHREVKLSNIFINKRDILQLGDIGTECHMRNQSLENTHYIAPELWLGGLSTQASDVYAVGVVAYRMFTDRMPFVATDATQMAMKHVKLAAKPLRHYSPNLPEWLADLVALMLHKNPESRPTVQDLLHRFLAQRQ